MSGPTARLMAPKGNDIALVLYFSSRADHAEALAGLGLVLRAVQARFALPVVLCAPSPDEVPIDWAARSARKHLVARVFYTARSECHPDAVSLAPRVSAQHYVFCAAHEALQALPELLQLIVEIRGTSAPLVGSRHGRAVAVDRASIGRYAELQDWRASPARAGQSAAEHLFVSASAVRRFGGIARFKTLPLRFDGHPISAFGRIWVVGADPDDEELAATPGIEPVPDLHPGPAGRSVLVDINPGPSAVPTPASDDGSSFFIPRQMMVLMGVPVELAPAVPVAPAVMIASSFNKAAYIGASLYSMLSQTVDDLVIDLVDDGSTDSSIAIASALRELLTHPELLRISSTERNCGTYWIRNAVVLRHGIEAVYFVNDSDDYSSAQRVRVQLAELGRGTPLPLGCFHDIVRTGADYEGLSIDGEMERIGTASLCFKGGLIRKAGHFQSLRKNADTEFIERVNRFLGKSAVPWRRYACLFQPFDGTNLTSDIYVLESDQAPPYRIQRWQGHRAVHTEAYRRHHARIKVENLPAEFPFPSANLPREYADLTEDFVDRCYAGSDMAVVLFGEKPTPEAARRLQASGFCLLVREGVDRWRWQPPKGSGLILSVSLDQAGDCLARLLKLRGFIVTEGLFQRRWSSGGRQRFLDADIGEAVLMLKAAARPGVLKMIAADSGDTRQMLPALPATLTDAADYVWPFGVESQGQALSAQAKR